MSRFKIPTTELRGSLIERMRMRAETDARFGEELKTLASGLDQVVTDFARGDTTVQKLVGTWAKARRRWCQITGESLV